ncbi:3-methyl-2-oxobutanoate hydroxymethyltransferase [Tindallia californiensis]|uniref:3-methyl-2-oxobutanoate hydroxymethyltransferase n=1 Tax=Tindallia californiensis TaxID=159292 RepID=A0A1H3MIM6_9FIRM|nr:3-methyl-2-oxobutanoate hydroxymethyltransferase [Tindallia californiensis]SDY76228.1 ketopantoate hydroxymethyltransferase [Tindallia californiensis]
MSKITTQKLRRMKEEGEKISMVTAYDYPTSVLANRAGIDVVLVGDSLAMTILGEENTVSIGMKEMVYHIKPVVKGAPDALVVGDMPFGSYQISKKKAVKNAVQLMKKGGCDAVKLEGGAEMAEVVKAIVDAGIPVMGHIGLTPQTVSKLGGFKVQGKSVEAAEVLLKDALKLQEAGAWGLVLEAIPEEVGKLITKKSDIPTIGIGAGRYCDGQVLVFHDMFGLFQRFVPKFVKQYGQLGDQVVDGLETFKKEIQEGRFPASQHKFSGVEEEELTHLY